MINTSERADAARNRQAILDAAAELFAATEDPSAITMDAIAKAASVGKGTLFRRFGDRTTLLRAVFDAKVEKLTHVIESGLPPLGPETPAVKRIPAILDAIAELKLTNRSITQTVETISTGSVRNSPFLSDRYTMLEELLEKLLAELIPVSEVTFTAHALLSTIRVDLLDTLSARKGLSKNEIRRELRTYVRRILQPSSGSPGADI